MKAYQKFSDSYMVIDGNGNFFHRGGWSPIFRPSGLNVARGYTTLDGAYAAIRKAGLEEGSYKIEAMF